MKKAICWHSGFMRMMVQRHESSIEFLHSSLNAARGDEPISPPSLASYAWHNSYSLRRRCCLLDDADEWQGAPPVDVVLLLRQDEGLRGHHLQLGLPRADATVLQGDLERKKIGVEI